MNLGYDSGGGTNTLGRLAFAKNPQVWEVYGYTPAGLLASKQMTITIHGQPPLGGTGGTLSYTYNNEGQVSSVSYPAVWVLDSHGLYVQQDGPVYDYSFDTMGRPAGLVEDNSSTTMVNNVQYGAAGQMLQMVDVPANLTHTFQYNNLLQLTRTTSKYSGTTRMDIQYTYSSTQNNGQITQSQDFVSGEQVNYQYDCLQRLISAATTGSQWGLSFSYDGFGNRLSEVATKGPAPTVYSTYDPATNRITGYTHDNNGNITHQPNGTWLTYDVENRIVSANANGTIENYAYAPDGKRVYRQTPDDTEYIFFYGAQGERIGPYIIGPYNHLMTTSSKPIVYFAGRRLGVNEDRLGSQRRRLYPYGESENTPLSEDDVFFATYVRDGVTGLDYAVNRYYSSIIARFMSPDPYMANNGGPGNPSDPASWNRYSYTRNDPVNRNDPAGLVDGCAICMSLTPGTVVELPPSPQPTVVGILDLASLLSLFSPALLPPRFFPGLFFAGQRRGAPSVVKTYSEAVKCNERSAQLLKNMEANFSAFANYSGTFGPSGVPVAAASVQFSGSVAPGSIISINDIIIAPNPWGPPGVITQQVAVQVTDVSSTSFTFTTLPGHVLYPATISFSSTDVVSNQITFTIGVNGDFANATSGILYHLGGSNLEDNIWNNVLASVEKDCSK